MAEHELKVFVPAEEGGENTAETSGDAGDIRSRQSNGCDGKEVDPEFQQGPEWEDDESSTQWGAENKSNSERNREELLLHTVKEESYHKVHGKVTAKALMNYGDNPLLLAIRVAEELHSRADKDEPDRYDFIKLASRVEEFTLRFLDPLKYERLERQYFFNNPETDFIVETAIRLKQKKVIVKRLSSLCLACQTSPLCYCIIDSLKISYQK